MSNSTSFVPAESPPEGVTPNFEHPEDVYYSANLINAAVCVGVVNSAFILHAYVKLVVKRAWLLHEDGTSQERCVFYTYINICRGEREVGNDANAAQDFVLRHGYVT